MSSNPYADLPSRQFWRSAVAEKSPLAPEDLCTPKWRLSKKDKIATAGSCFAQHLTKHLIKSGFSVLDFEPPPKHLREELHNVYGFSLFSARYGNIYTTRQLLCLAREAFSISSFTDICWQREGRFFDALRPSIEPQGLDSAEEVLRHRKYHLARVRELLLSCDIFVFTLGLTEAWLSKENGLAFPTAPGVIAGHYDPEKFQFHNFCFVEIMDDFKAFVDLVNSHRSSANSCRFLVTVSPIPLTATYVDQNVLLATTYSKSVLRGVAGELSQKIDLVDYFPSFEIINSVWSRGIFYENNLRSINAKGVETVMSYFLANNVDSEESPATPRPSQRRNRGQKPIGKQVDNSVQCDEALLEGFQ